MTPAAMFLIDLLVKATLLMIAAHLLVLATRRASAGRRHLVISSALIALLALPVTTMVLGVVELPVFSSAVAPAPVQPERLLIRLTASTPAAGEPGARELPGPANQSSSGLPAGAGASADPDVEAPIASSVSLPLMSLDGIQSWISSHVTVPLVLVSIWMIGALVLLAHLTIGIARVQWIADRAIPLRDDRTLALLRDTASRVGVEKEPSVLISPDLSVPVVWGLSSPVLLLPLESAKWSDDRTRAVLLHELAHIARRDGFTLILINISIALHWINPLVWSAARMSRRYCERACDDIVLERGTRASEYADHLLAIARTLPDRERLATVTLAMSRRSEIESRLLAILHPDLRRAAITRRASIAAAAIAAAFVITLGSVRLTAEEPTAADSAREGSTEAALVPDLEVSVGADRMTGEDESPSVWSKKEKRTASNDNSNTNWNTNSNYNVNYNYNYNSDGKGTSGRKSSDRKIDKEARQAAARLWEEAWNAHQDGRFSESIPLFMKTAELGHRGEASRYNVACGYAMQGDVANAVVWLERAIANGFDDWDLISRDSDLDPIRSDTRFRALVESLPARDESRKSKSRTDRVMARYEELRSSRTADASEWSETGRLLLGLRKLDEAEAALRRAIELSSSPAVISMYNMACLEALRGNEAEALNWLDRAIESGLDRTEKILSDPDLKSIRGTAGYERAVKKSKVLSVDQFMKGQSDEESEATRRRRWEPAILLYSRYTSSYPDSGRAWWNLAWAQHSSGAFPEAVKTFERALNLGYRPANTSYNIACGHARMGHSDLAFQWLERAAQHGFEMGDRIRWDDDLASLRGDRRADRLFERKHDS